MNKCKILFLAANPENTTKLALDEECREIEQKIRASEYRDSLELITKWAVRPDDLLQYLNQHQPHIVHFSGHGSPYEEIILLDSNRNPKPVSKEALKQLFTTLKDNIRVVVLNACFSRPQAEAITEVIDCAIGMNKAIGDRAAITFAASFYQALGFGRSVKKAFDQGITALMLEGISEENTPELLVRSGIDANSVILIQPEESNPISSTKSSELGIIQTTPIPSATPKTFLAKLPISSPDFFGREQELEILDQAWADPKTHIIMLSAWGGVGKTALVNNWLNLMEQNNYRGAIRIYGWSFYSQGTREDRQASSDEFLAHTLEWFRDPDPKKGAPWDKGIRLANLIRQQKTLLILDGLEPLQYPPGEMQGRLKDQGVQALLKELSRGNLGLCIITTREPVRELEEMKKTSVKHIRLDNLIPESGAELLKHLGVIGTHQELLDATKEFKGHALALTLLGKYLAVVHDGEIRKRDLISALEEEEEQGGHARRIMKSYELWLKGKPELDILYLMGLFDRPAEGGAIARLRRNPVIQGLTDALQNLTDTKWKYAICHLRELRLLAEKDESEPDTLDCHPLIREHFGEKLKKEKSKAWKQAHSRLYEHFRGLPKKEYPDTLAEMEPLFRAVFHGCQAGRHHETLIDVYWERIKRRDEHYSTQRLGAFGADLAALSGFFKFPWYQPAVGLTIEDETGVLSWAGSRLHALGRLQEARIPMEIGLLMRIQQENWKDAAIIAGNLSELTLTLGEITTAVDYARQSIAFADQSKDAFQRLSKRTILADILHQQGDLATAEQLFLEAEKIQQEYQPEYSILYSIWGFWFCDLLLSQNQIDRVQKRTYKTIEIARQNKWLLSIALDNLSLGRADLLEGLTISEISFQNAKQHLNQAVQSLREAGTQHHIPRGLLVRAVLRRVTKSFISSWYDLEEAKEIAKRGEMKLYLADYHLEVARLFCIIKLASMKPKEYPPVQGFFKIISESGEIDPQVLGSNPDYAKIAMDKAIEHYTIAKEMVYDMGYGRRYPEIAELEKQLKIKNPTT
ncbi:MAG: CHAT domain-containing protein [bacterium]